MKKIIKTVSTTLVVLLFTNCGNKAKEICVCFKKAANTYMVKGEMASEQDLMSMCAEFEGSGKSLGMEDKRKCLDCLDTVKQHLKDKILFTDVEDVKLSPLPCGSELISVLREKSEDKSYFLKGREVACELAVYSSDNSNGGKLIVTGVFFNDTSVFDIALAPQINILLPKSESANVLLPIKKGDAYDALYGKPMSFGLGRTDSHGNDKMYINTDGPLAFKQIIKFKGKEIGITLGGYGLPVYYIDATEYEFIKPDAKIHKQQHHGYKDFVFEASTNTPAATTPKEQLATNTNTDTKVTSSIPPPAIVYYKIQDPDGYSNLRKEPNGTIIKKVSDNEKFEVIGTEGKFKKVKLSDGTVGFISASRIVQIN
jgi:hypothetical protein